MAKEVNLVKELKDSISLANVVAMDTKDELQGTGQGYKTCCPFPDHVDENPSFYIYEETNSCYCYSCNRGGDIFDYVKYKYQLTDFTECLDKVKELAGGNKFTKPAPKAPPGNATDLEMLNSLEKATQLYQQCLNSKTGENARQLLLDRGVDMETCEKFRIGYAPSNWSFLSNANPELTEPWTCTGLCSKTGWGVQDKFYNRIMIPLTNIHSQVVAFSGRTLKEYSTKKYVNSHSTALFKKSNELFAINLAANPIYNTKIAIVVEGQLDTVALHQNGLDNSVAIMGSSISKSQLNILDSIANDLIFVYDGDTAGHEAAHKTTLTIQHSQPGRTTPRNVKIIVLPDGYDPNSFLIKYGVDDFLNLM